MAWILVVGHALNLVLNKVSATSVYSFGNCGLEAYERRSVLITLEKGSVGIQVREVRKVDKGRRDICASIFCFFL